MSLTSRSVNVIMLGRMGFMPAYDLQKRYAREHLDEMAGKPNAKGENTLLLVEHRPVYTVGVRTKGYTEDDVEILRRTGADFYTTNRGGLITFHGPGQLVAYPILNLTQFQPSMKWYVSKLEKTLLATLERFGLKGRLTDQTGVWVENRKIASIGLHGSRYVTTHGIGLNCSTELKWFRHIVPCGLHGIEMTSLTKELEKTVTVSDATAPFLSAFQEVFDCDLEFRMLDKEDLKLLQDSKANEHNTLSKSATAASVTSEGQVISPDKTTVVNGGPGHNTSGQSEVISPVSKLDQRMEMGVRMMSTLSSSSSLQSPVVVPSSSSSISSSSSSSSSLSSPSSSQSTSPILPTHVSYNSESSNSNNNSISKNNNNNRNSYVDFLIQHQRRRGRGPMW